MNEVIKESKIRQEKNTYLLLSVGRGNIEAFRQLYEVLHLAVRSYLASIDNSMDYHEKEDLVQEVFFQTLLKASSFKGNASAKTFIFAIAKNVLRKQLVRRHRLRIVPTHYLDDLVDTHMPGGPENTYQHHRDEISKLLQQAMGKLTEAQRQAVELDQIRNLPRKEALKLANCNAQQFANRLYRGMKSLRSLLRDPTNYILL